MGRWTHSQISSFIFGGINTVYAIGIYLGKQSFNWRYEEDYVNGKAANYLAKLVDL